MTREIVFQQTAKVTAPRMRGRADAGVTLLELLVSITIVALLASTALFAWRVGVSAWEKVGTQLEKGRGVLAAHQLLQEQIASMVPYEAWPEQRGRVVFFQGEAETARFVSRYSLTDRAASGLYLIEYHVAAQQGGTKQLLLKETPVRGNEELGALIRDFESHPEGVRLRLPPFERDPETVVLLEGLQECRFEYYRLASTGEQGIWTDEWVNRPNEVPPAMRIHAAASGDAGELAPVTIVAAVRNFARWRPLGILGILGL